VLKELIPIIEWGQQDKNIRVMILEGSMAAHDHVDELSDFDLNLFVVDKTRYTDDNSWMKKYGDILIFQKNNFKIIDVNIPSTIGYLQR